MAPSPRNTPKSTPQGQRKIVKTNKAKPSVTSLKKVMTSKKTEKKLGNKAQKEINTPLVESRKRTNTLPKLSTPKAKENKTSQRPDNVTKSAMKASWNRRPAPAHSGVPRPEKMKNLDERLFLEPEFIL
ncbi:unnamed protein product [Leptidea sinapis]|uniref:Uncharacterized protein n=1 Tax=Leptidea sinapis TaxID=189913 RepID=A0A5E4QKI1_9NEOP|nr:unnamed protein product [Leptidea sinapis]